MKVLRLLIGVVGALLLATSVSAATITVCASGCTNINSALQTALNNANPGDTILLQQNFTYVGNFLLPDRKSCPAQNATCYITLKTGVSSTGAVLSSSLFPAANKSVTPAYTSVLAKLQASCNNCVALRTIEPAHTVSGACGGTNCITQWWTIQLIEVLPHAFGGYQLIQLGNNETSGAVAGGTVQGTKALIPHHLIVDQVYFHGDAQTGQNAGIGVNADFVTIQNSYCAEVKVASSDSHDSQCIVSSGNLQGTLTVTNNYLQASTQSFMSGGDNVRISATRTILASPTPTTTSATMSSAITDLAVGDVVTFQVGGSAVANHQSGVVATIAGAAITWAPALTAAPDSPGQAAWNIVPKTLTFTKNYLTKDTNWRNPIISTPTNLAVSSSPTGGTFGAGTYTYRVVARRTVANGIVATSTATAEGGVTVASGTTSSVTISWTPVASADFYNIYGRGHRV